MSKKIKKKNTKLRQQVKMLEAQYAEVVDLLTERIELLYRAFLAEDGCPPGTNFIPNHSCTTMTCAECLQKWLNIITKRRHLN